jgi:hypothetical protein
MYVQCCGHTIFDGRGSAASLEGVTTRRAVRAFLPLSNARIAHQSSVLFATQNLHLVAKIQNLVSTYKVSIVYKHEPHRRTPCQRNRFAGEIKRVETLAVPPRGIIT